MGWIIRWTRLLNPTANEYGLDHATKPISIIRRAIVCSLQLGEWSEWKPKFGDGKIYCTNVLTMWRGDVASDDDCRGCRFGYQARWITRRSLTRRQRLKHHQQQQQQQPCLCMGLRSANSSMLQLTGPDCCDKSITKIKVGTGFKNSYVTWIFHGNSVALVLLAYLHA